MLSEAKHLRWRSSEAAFAYVMCNKSHRLYAGQTTDLLDRVGSTRARKVELIQDGNPNWIDLTSNLEPGSYLR